MEDNRIFKVSLVFFGSDVRFVKVIDEIVEDIVFDEEGEDGGERKVFLFLFFCF